MKWWGYLLLELASIFFAFLSAFFWMFNFITRFLIYMVSPLVKSMDYEIGGADIASTLIIGFFYPLTFVPLHWLNYKILKGNWFSYVLLLLLANLIIAFFVVWHFSWLPACYYGCPRGTLP